MSDRKTTPLLADASAPEVVVSRSSARPPARSAAGDWVIGSLNNTYGVHQADLISDRSIDEWVTEALLYELRQAGFSAMYVERLPPTAGRGISITDITVVLNENKGIFSADTKHELRFNVEVFLNGARSADPMPQASRPDSIAWSAS